MYKLNRDTAKLVLLADGIPIDASTEDSPGDYFELSRQADNLVILWHGTLNALGCPNSNTVLRDDPQEQVYQTQVTWTVPAESSNNSSTYTVCPIDKVDEFIIFER